MRREVSIWSKGQFIHYPGPEPDGAPVMARIVDVNDLNSADQMRQVDPRKLGVIPNTVLNLVHSPLDRNLGNPERKACTEQEALLGDEECRLVTIEPPRGATVRYWIVPEKNYGVIQVQTDSLGEGKQGRFRATSELEQVRDGVWFPRRVDFERRENDQVVRAEHSEIRVVSLNEEIDESVFTLAGAEIPVGWPIWDARYEDGRSRVWDGSRVVLRDQPVPPPMAIDLTRLAMWSASLVLAAVAGFMIWRFVSAARRPA